MGTPTPKGAGVNARLPRKAKVFQEWPWISWEWPWMTRERLVRVELVLELYQEYPGVAMPVMGLHHVSQGSNQGEFRNGGASMWVLPCEFYW